MSREVWMAAPVVAPHPSILIGVGAIGAIIPNSAKDSDNG
jgi:hypothetical protein